MKQLTEAMMTAEVEHHIENGDEPNRKKWHQLKNHKDRCW